MKLDCYGSLNRLFLLLSIHGGNLLQLSHMEDASSSEVENIKEQAKVALQAYLDKNYRLIRAMRANKQFYAQGNLDGVVETRKFIESNRPSYEHEPFSKLCAILEAGILLPHDRSHFNPNDTVRGFYFETAIGLEDNRALFIGCVDLDGGLSRKYFDDKSPKEKQDYMAKILQNPLTLVEDKPRRQKPPVGIAFITDRGGKFEIEDLEISSPEDYLARFGGHYKH